MVHGACSSKGCFAMTDEAMSEIYAIAREAFPPDKPLSSFSPIHSRMTSENLAKHRADPHFAFWKNLKEGSDVFEVTAQEPIWTVSGGRYVFAREPAFASEIAAKTAKDDSAAAALVTKGLSAVRLVYQDGGGHPSLKKMALAAASAEASVVLDERTRRSLGDISRPDALASEPQEIPVTAGPSDAPRPVLR
jgi:murein L,D-transpeptidase YafK